tara:strand:- start:18592 stop:19401 length:810 start_codon:yes stop_codon:yes gene_type:complete
MGRNVLITGISGFLGREIAKQLGVCGDNITGIGHSEKRAHEADFILDEVQLYCLDLSHDVNQLDHIMKKHDIEYVIHTAAMKHVGLSQDNPYRAVEVNVIGSKNVLDVSYSNGVKNLVGISTDKAINPSCVYGSTKHLMEKMFLEKGYPICRGVNFLFSDGSVLDIWRGQAREGKPITVNKNDTTRFFIDVKDFADLVLKSMAKKEEIFLPPSCYKISLHDLAQAFCEVNSCTSEQIYTPSSAEKAIEDIPDEIKVIPADLEMIKGLLK